MLLPTKRTLGRYSTDLIFKSGADPKMFEVITNIVKDWPQRDKLCALTWDEVSLNEHLDYSQAQDRIEGLVDTTTPEAPVFATHSLTFTVRETGKLYKQTIGYFYTT